MLPNPTRFPLFPGPSSHPCTSPHQIKKFPKYNLRCPYTHWSLVELPVAQALKENWVFHLNPHQQPPTAKSYAPASLSQFLRTLYNGLLSGFSLGWGLVREAVSRSQSAGIDTIAKESFLFLAVCSSTDHELHMVSSSSTDHGHQPGLWTNQIPKSQCPCWRKTHPRECLAQQFSNRNQCPVGNRIYLQSSSSWLPRTKEKT